MIRLNPACSLARPRTRHIRRRLALPPPVPPRVLSPTPVEKLQLKVTSLWLNPALSALYRLSIGTMLITTSTTTYASLTLASAERRRDGVDEGEGDGEREGGDRAHGWSHRGKGQKQEVKASKKKEDFFFWNTSSTNRPSSARNPVCSFEADRNRLLNRIPEDTNRLCNPDTLKRQKKRRKRKHVTLFS